MQEPVPKTYVHTLPIRSMLGEIKMTVSPLLHHQIKDLMVAAMAQIVPFLLDLDPELTNFCSHLHITFVLRDFHNDEDESDPEICVSNQSSDIKDESELKRFI